MIDTYGILQKVGYRTFHVRCSEDLNKYLRSLYRITTYGVSKLLPPMNGSHITVNYGVSEALKADSGERIKFSVILDVFTNGNAYWLNVVSPDLEEIRIRSGLSARPEIDFHYCIGYLREGKD